MDYTVLEDSTLFRGVPAKDLRAYLEETPYHIQCYDKEETIFHLMDPAFRIAVKALHSIEAAGKALAEQKSAMDEKREHYAKAEKAESLRGVIDTFETAEGQAETRKRVLEAQRAKLPDTEAAAEEAKRRKDEHEQSSPVEDLTKKIGEYEKKTEIYREYNVLTASFVTSKEEQLKAQTANDSAKTALDSATKAAKDKKVDFDAADEKAGDYRDRYFAGIYGEIAQELIEGESCPVCGSKSILGLPKNRLTA